MASRPTKKQRKLEPSSNETRESRRTAQKTERPVSGSQNSISSDAKASAARSQQGKTSKVLKRSSGNRGIHSFFNPITQTQRLDPESSRPGTDHDGAQETDDSIDDESVAPAIPSNVKRSAPSPASSSPESSNMVAKGPEYGKSRPKISKKFLVSSEQASFRSSAVDATSAENDLSTSWAEAFPPQNTDELAVHPKKVGAIRKWLLEATSGKGTQNLLILKGPSGCGKSAAIRTIASAGGIVITDWINPVGYDHGSEGFVSLSTQFDDFLSQASRYEALNISTPNDHDNAGIWHAADSGTVGRGLTLVEDIPNTFSRDSSALAAFRSSVLRYVAACASQARPLVLIVTETLKSRSATALDTFTVGRLLGGDILSHPATTVIELNPVAPALMAKALSRVVRKAAARRSVTGALKPGLMKQLAQFGDIRCAIHRLEFISASEQSEGIEKSVPANRLPVLHVQKNTIIPHQQIACRESTIDMFHAVAKVLYNKRTGFQDQTHQGGQLSQPPIHLMTHTRRQASDVLSEQLLDDIGTDIQTFIAGLHENYVLSCAGDGFLEALNACVDNLSVADLLGPIPNELSFHTAVQGLLFSLPCPVKRGECFGKGESKIRDPFKMMYPTSCRLWKITEEAKATMDDISRHLVPSSPCSRLDSTEKVLYCMPYWNMIKHAWPTSNVPRYLSSSDSLRNSNQWTTEDSHNLHEMGEVLPGFYDATILSEGHVSAVNNSYQDGEPLLSQGMLAAHCEDGLVLSDDDIEDD